MTRRTDAYFRALEDMRAINHLITEAERRMMDARASLPGAATYDGPSVTGGTSSSPTERHALTGDPTQRDRDSFDRSLRILEREAANLRRITEAWTPHAPTARDRAQVERANDPAPECAITRDLIGQHEPVHVLSDCGGVLPAAVPVCRWVYDFVRQQGRTPTVGELERHHKGLVVRVGA